MAVTLQVGSSFEDAEKEPYAVFLRTLIWYFHRFDKSTVIYDLSCVPFYDDKCFDIEFCQRLMRELPELMRLASENKLPHTPIGLDKEDGFDEELGCEDVLMFFKDLSSVLESALASGRPMVAIGD